MNSGWYDSPWFIALATIFITYLSTPVFNTVVGWVRSRRGRLTGTYLALTKQNDVLLVERATCWQIGDRLRGHVDAVIKARISGYRITDYEQVSAHYKFTGRTTGHTLMLTYWDPSKTEEAGTIILKTVARSEDVHVGKWAGSTRLGFIRGPCLWLRIHSRDFPRNDFESFLVGFDSILAVTHVEYLLADEGAFDDYGMVEKTIGHSSYSDAISREIKRRRDGLNPDHPSEESE